MVLSRLHSNRSSYLLNGGFTYVALLILIAIIGLASAATVQMSSLVQRRAAEENLLDIGEQFRQALFSYANATPQGQPRSPATLQDLLKDPRYPNVVRHLRRLYIDPVTGSSDWGIIQLPDSQGISGVYSLSKASPIKIHNFSAAFSDFDGKTSYQDWRFIVSLPAVRLPGG